MLKRRIPTAEELRNKAEAIIDGISPANKQAWLKNGCTEALFLLLEASRMQSIEAMENGPPDEILRQYMSQSQLASSLIDDLQMYIVESSTDE